MKVTTEQVINRTKLNLGLTGTTHSDSFLEKLINEAATWHLDTLSSYIISCETLQIDCLKAKLPDAAVDLICYSFPDATGCSGCCVDCMNPHNANYQCSCPNWFVADRNILTEFCSNGSSAAISSSFFDVQNGYLIFPSTITQSTVKVWYRGLNIDEEGLAVIDERQERALSAYASSRYAIANWKSYSDGQRRFWNAEWVAQKQNLRGNAVLEDFRLHKAQAAAIARAILINPLMVTNRNG